MQWALSENTESILLFKMLFHLISKVEPMLRRMGPKITASNRVKPYNPEELIKKYKKRGP